MYKSGASASAMYMPTENKSNHNRSIHRQWVLGRHASCRTADRRDMVGWWKLWGVEEHGSAWPSKVN